MALRSILLVVCAIVFGTLLSGQSSSISLNYKTLHIVDRLDVLYGSTYFGKGGIRSIGRKEIVNAANRILKNPHFQNPSDIRDVYYLLYDNPEWSILKEKDSVINPYEFFEGKPVLKYFYTTPGAFFHLDKNDFSLVVNPVFNFKIGDSSTDGQFIFQNTRGIEIRGSIDETVYFHSSIYENQRRFNDYIEDRISQFRAIPGQGYYKKYNSQVFQSLSGWDYLNADASVGFLLSKSIQLEFGHDKNFLGNGYQSLLLSDYGHNYFQLKLQSHFWKFKYQNIFAEFSAIGSLDNEDNSLLPKKYMAAHYLEFEATKNFSIGLYEAVIFGRTDHFEFQYLNPVIFYRTVESFLDSPDNVLIGINWKWNLLQRIQLYGQFVFDEFSLNQIAKKEGWWGNKYGYQLGLKVFNLFKIDHLDGQMEYNRVRPFTYSHRDTILGLPDHTIASYSHYNQPLAHPLGANFNEMIFLLKYQPLKSVYCRARIIYSLFGDDLEEFNFGGNILRPFNSRSGDYGHSVGQGDKRSIQLYGLDISYEPFHNYFVDFQLLYRKQEQERKDRNFDTLYWGLGFRANIANQRLDY